jgi:hypothetical protein
MAGLDWNEYSPGFENRAKISDLIVVADKNKFKNKNKAYRFIGPVYQYREIWVPIYRDGKPLFNKNKHQVKIPLALTNYDGDTQKFIPGKVCPYQELAEKMNKYLDSKNQITERSVSISNAINRDMQDNMPRRIIPPTKEENRTGFKDITTKSWTPVEAFTLVPTLARKIKGIMEDNVYKKKDGTEAVFSIAHKKYGKDIKVRFDPEEKGSAMYNALNGERSPLSVEEEDYLIWDIESAIKTQIDTPKEAKKNADNLWKEFEKYLRKSGKGRDRDRDDEDGSPEDLEDEGDNRSRRNNRRRDDEDEDKPRRSRSRDDEDEDKPRNRRRDLLDEDEDEKPRRGRNRDLDEDDERPRNRRNRNDEPDVDLDEDEKPRRRRNRDDEDEDKPRNRRNRNLDEEEDEKPRRRRDDEEDRPRQREERSFGFGRKPRSRDDEDERPRNNKRNKDKDEEPRRGRNRRDEELDNDEDIPF